MVTTELNTPRATGIAGAIVMALTAVGLALGAIAPGLAGGTAPHPTLTGSVGEAVSILQNNLRVLAAPYLLWLLGFDARRLTRRAGDLLILVIAAQSILPVGVELARWRARLLPYLPQLPLEWAALALAISVWLLIRTTVASRRQVAVLAALTAGLLTGAAGVETWCTPRRSVPTVVTGIGGDGMRDGARLVGAGGCRRPELCAAGGRVAARSLAPFPSLRSVPLGRIGGADRALSTTTDPHKEGSIT